MEIKKIAKKFFNLITLRFIRKRIKIYLNTHPIVLKMILNIFGTFSYGNYVKVAILKFCGSKIGKHVGIGNNLYIFFPKNLEMEDYSSISDNAVVCCWSKIHFGSYTFMSTSCCFIAGSHNNEDYNNILNQEIFIGKGVWLGANSTIMGGAVIRNGCIIGAGTVLRGKEYPPFSIIAGVPGKIIKQRKPAPIIKQPYVYSVDELIEEQEK